MTEIGSFVQKLRSKNAGPFWLTIDIFCGTPEAFSRACAALPDNRVARTLGIDPAQLKRFEIDGLNLLKFSLPRPAIQGAPEDRDMHGASWASLLAELPETA